VADCENLHKMTDRKHDEKESDYLTTFQAGVMLSSGHGGWGSLERGEQLMIPYGCEVVTRGVKEAIR
jgi:hypothetical protein